MKYIKLFVILIGITIFASCRANESVGTSESNKTKSERQEARELTVVETPEKINAMMKARGDIDNAEPTLKFVEPRENAVINSSTVKVKLELGGDLRGYKTGKDPDTGMGNHIHVILDNEPYEAYYNLEEEFELKNVPDGKHTLRVFPSRPWHESYKNNGAFQMVRFSVRNGNAEADKPTITNSGQKVADATSNSDTNNRNADTKDPDSMVDFTKPILTYSRPKGEYKGTDAEAIMIDFWLSNAKLVGDGGKYMVRYTIDGSKPRFIEKWSPVWLTGWNTGKSSIKLELVDKDGNFVKNGTYNSTTREITVAK